MAYAASDIYQALVDAGLSPSVAGTLTQVSGAESSYGANPVSPTNANGTTDYGLFQINSGAWPQLNPSSLVDAPLATQANAAATVYNQQGLSAWSTYNSGAYQNYSTGNTTLATGESSIAASQGGFLNWLMDPGLGNEMSPNAAPDPSGSLGGASTQAPEGGGAAIVNGANAVAGSNLFTEFTGWLSSIASRAGLFVLAILFIIGALILFGIKSGIDIETSQS